MSDYSDSSYVSPDRVIVSLDGKIREAVEIKCLSSEKVLKIWWDTIHLENGESQFNAIPNNLYKAQVLKYFIVNKDLEKLYWVVYTDLIPNLELQVLEVNRTDIEKYIDDAELVEKTYIAMLEKAEELLQKNL